MEQRIDEIITELDSRDIQKRNEAIQIVNCTIQENDQVLTLLVEQYYVSFSENILHTIVSLVTESRAQLFFDAVKDEFVRLPSDNLKPTLSLLSHLVSRHDPEPTWLYLLVGHELLNEIFSSFQYEINYESLPLGLVFVSMLLPLAPVRLNSSFYLNKLFELLQQGLNTYHHKDTRSWDCMQRICFHYLVTLYSLYPTQLLGWIRALDITSPAGVFSLKYGKLLKLHVVLLTSDEMTEAVSDRESHDIIWEISCYTESFDLMYEAKMLSGIKDYQVTEMHDVSWESTDAAHLTRSVGSQTVEETNETSEIASISDSLISTYLEKSLIPASGQAHRRRNSHRFEHDSAEDNRTAVMVLEGELMLEKYLRFQHERRNRRYLSQVRQCYSDISYCQAYKRELETLKTELGNAEAMMTDLTTQIEKERVESQEQLYMVTEKINKEIDVLKRTNLEAERNEKESNSKVEMLEKKIEEMATNLLDLQSVNGQMAEKQKELEVYSEHNKTLRSKLKQLSSQVFVLNELRAFQCDALNALKPFCYKQPSPTKDTPDVTNLQKLASEANRKYDNSEAELRRLRCIKDALEAEITSVKEKLAKQKSLTEKTTNFWEQKYSGLEKTCSTYKNTYIELSQKVVKLKRELEQRPPMEIRDWKLEIGRQG